MIERLPVTAPTSSPSPSREEPPSIGEVVNLVTTYAKQETVGPMKGAARWLGMGAAGAVVLGLGLVLLLLGLLRVIQTEWDRSSTGSLSWLPYLIVLVVCVLLIVLVLSRINRDTLHKESK